MTPAEELTLTEAAIQECLLSQRLSIGGAGGAVRAVDRVRYSDLCKRADQLRDIINSSGSGDSMASLVEMGRVL